jgi:hypothetical protein
VKRSHDISIATSADDFIFCAVETGLVGWGGWIRTSAFQNRNSPRLSASAAGFEPLHIEII